MKSIPLYLIFLGIMSSCHYSVERENNEIDHLEARKKCEKFLLFINEARFDSAIAYTRDISVSSLENNEIKIDSLLGNAISCQYSNIESKVVCKQQKCNGSISVFFDIKRTKKDSRKTLYLEVIENDMKIVGYDEKFDF